MITGQLRPLFATLAMVVVIGAGTSRAHAEPVLQLYLEGATYDTATESWVLAPPGSSAGAPFRLWVIGNVDGPGGKGVIEDVKLSAVYNTTVGPLTISITSAVTGGYNGFSDPSSPGAAVLTTPTPVTDGSTPLLGDGSPLPAHGQYGAGRSWQEFLLGDFSLEDSQIADFNGDVSNPVPTTGLAGQINVYEISVAPGPGSTEFGEHPFEIHFDAYNHVEAGNHSKYTFAPFSHDAGADATTTIVPEPPPVVLLGSGLMLIGLAVRRRRQLA